MRRAQAQALPHWGGDWTELERGLVGCCAYEIISAPLPPLCYCCCCCCAAFGLRRHFLPQFAAATATAAAVQHFMVMCCARLAPNSSRPDTKPFMDPLHSLPQPPLLHPWQAERAINWLIKRRVASFSLPLSPSLPTRLIAVQLTYNLDIAFDLPSPYGAREMVAHSLHTLHLPLASCRVATRCLSLLLRSLLLLPLRVVFVALPIDQWQLQTVPPTPLLSYSLLIFAEQCQRQGLLYGTRHCRRGYSRVAPSYSPANYPLAPTIDLTNELQPLLSYV